LAGSAIAVFVGSYFCTRPDALRRVQMAGALVWVVYGLLIEAYPVVVANLLVVGAAGWTVMRRRETERTDVLDKSEEAVRIPLG
jgi:hypothetical protein